MAWKEGDLDCLSEPLNDNIKKWGLCWLSAEMLRIRKRGFSSGPRLPRTGREVMACREQIQPMESTCPRPEEGPLPRLSSRTVLTPAEPTIRSSRRLESLVWELPPPCHSIFYPTHFHETGIGDLKNKNKNKKLWISLNIQGKNSTCPPLAGHNRPPLGSTWMSRTGFLFGDWNLSC